MDEELQLRKDQERFTRARDGTILFQGRIWVPKDSELKRLILEEAHKSNLTIHRGSTKMYQDLKKNYWWPGMKVDVTTFVGQCLTIHPGSTKMYQDLKKNYWWPGMKVDVTTFVGQCLTCQKVKIEHQRPADPSFHLHLTDGQTERTIQTLEDMLRACILEEGGNWDTHLPLVEFSYNNSYHASIGMTPYEALYGRKCRTPLCWSEIGDKGILGPEVIQETTEMIKVIKDKLKIAQSRQKSYADIRRRPLEFEEGDHVFLRVTPPLALEEC
uniref:Uncharacterized protein LOC113784409 n=1 Tax=Cicer arietinum TaxID=3827 RepID=A0A3Q7WXF2_CICAR|nr:uncharacterized protein LOC113784409 [Cicer arietinum]